MKQRRALSHIDRLFTGRKKTIIIGGLIVTVVGMLAAYGWWSVVAWMGVQKNATAAQTDISSQISTMVAMPVTTREQKATKHAALADIHQAITMRQTMCDVSVLISWQNRIETARTYQDACHDTLTKLKSIDSSLVLLTEYLHDEQALAGLITTASSGPSDLDETHWQEVAARWHTLTSTAKELKVGNSFDAVLQRSITGVTQLDTCWQEVLAANAAKDRTRFQTATDELSKAYGAFKDITQLNTEKFSVLQANFEREYLLLTK